MEPQARVHFALPAVAENVPLVRHVLAGMAEALEMHPPDIADLKTVVTEACMNAVVHAYEPDDPGSLEVEAEAVDGSLAVTVRDYGRGIRPLADVEHRSLRLGLPLIAALTSSFEVSGGPERGTTVVMRIPIKRAENGAPAETPELGSETRITAPAGELLGPILSRVIAMFAARADFSVDRLSDAVLLGDAISFQGPDAFADGTARIAVSEEDGAFELRVGPLGPGGGKQLLDGMQIPQLGASLERLADEMTVEPGEGAEHLLIRISQPSA